MMPVRTKGQMITVVLVHDEELVRSGLPMIRRTADDIDVVGEGEHGGDAVRLARQLEPDVVLLDIRMPGTDALTVVPSSLCSPARRRWRCLTTFSMDEYVHRALRGGHGGFCSRTLRHAGSSTLCAHHARF